MKGEQEISGYSGKLYMVEVGAEDDTVQDLLDEIRAGGGVYPTKEAATRAAIRASEHMTARVVEWEITKNHRPIVVGRVIKVPNAKGPGYKKFDAENFLAAKEN